MALSTPEEGKHLDILTLLKMCLTTITPDQEYSLNVTGGGGGGSSALPFTQVKLFDVQPDGSNVVFFNRIESDGSGGYVVSTVDASGAAYVPTGTIEGSVSAPAERDIQVDFQLRVADHTIPVGRSSVAITAVDAITVNGTPLPAGGGVTFGGNGERIQTAISIVGTNYYTSEEF